MALQCDDFDAETSALIARITLDDIEEIGLLRKGKERYDAPLTDADVALQAQAESLQTFLKVIEDYQFARSIDSALAVDQDCLAAFSLVAQGEEDDHRAALALYRGQPLPQASESQKALENPTPVQLT